MVTKIISHRGRTLKNSEDNTLQAISNTINLNIDMAEVDIRKTKDSQIICRYLLHPNAENLHQNSQF